MIGNYVYFISAGTRVKIGVTSDLDMRISQLQVGNPYKLELIKILEFDTFGDARRAEKAIHKKYDELRIKTHLSEWFYYSDDFLCEESILYIKELKNKKIEGFINLLGEPVEIFSMKERVRCFFYSDQTAQILDSLRKSQRKTIPFRTMRYPTYGKQMLLPYSDECDRVFICYKKHKENMELNRLLKQKIDHDQHHPMLWLFDEIDSPKENWGLMEFLT